MDKQEALLRQRWEPLVEIMQHKGDSECRGGAPDELCSFEKLPFSRMQDQPFRTTWKPAALIGGSFITFQLDPMGQVAKAEVEGLAVYRRAAPATH